VRLVSVAAGALAALAGCGPHGTYRFTPGSRTSYRVRYTSDSSTSLGALMGGSGGTPEPFRVVLEGTMLVSVLEADRHGARMAWRFADVKLEMTGQAAIFQSGDAIRADLERETFGSVNEQGRVNGVRFDGRVSPASQTFARTLLGITQFVSAGKRDATEWDAQEDDPAGPYEAHYAAVRTAAAGTFQKVKMRYTGATTRSTAPVWAFTAVFDSRAGRLQSLEGTEEQEVARGGRTIGRAVNSVRLRYTGEDRVKPEELAVLRRAYEDRERAGAAVALSAAPSEEERQRALAASTLGATTMEELAAAIREMDQRATPPSKDETTPLFLKVRALVYLHPEACRPLGAMLQEAPANGLTMRLLAEAFTSAGTPETQHEVVTAMRERSGDMATFTTLSFALARTKSPTLETEEALSEPAFRDPESGQGKTAQLMLGAVARDMAASDPERAERVVDRLIALFESLHSPNASRRLLSVLGNAGSPRGLPTIVRYLHDPSADLRIGAASALRFVDGARADELLAQAAKDPAAPVRLAVVSALGYRETRPATLATLRRILQADPAANVRVAALRNLWQMRAGSTDAAALVRYAATHDTSEDVRRTAAGLLAGAR
jgi:HEAT repeats